MTGFIQWILWSVCFSQPARDPLLGSDDIIYAQSSAGSLSSFDSSTSSVIVGPSSGLFVSP
jgi:hypothetical protein